MAIKSANNYGYIDGANLYQGVQSLGWRLNYQKFRVWLKDKYNIKTAYLFLGLIPRYKELYKYLQESGFTLVFKEVVYDGYGKPKGNCDADLVLQSVRDVYEEKCDGAVIVASDGDYASTVSFLIEKKKLVVVLSPRNAKHCSILLKRTGARISYIDDQRALLEFGQKEKAPGRD